MGKQVIIGKIWENIQAHRAVKDAYKAMMKHEQSDFIIYVRSEDLGFVIGRNRQKELSQQISALIIQICEDKKINPVKFIDEIASEIKTVKILAQKLADIIDNCTDPQEAYEDFERELKNADIDKRTASDIAEIAEDILKHKKKRIH